MTYQRAKPVLDVLQGLTFESENKIDVSGFIVLSSHVVNVSKASYRPS